MTLYTYVHDHFIKKYPENTYEAAMTEYENCLAFAPNQTGQLSDAAQYIMFLTAAYHMQQVFTALKIDINTPTMQNSSHNVIQLMMNSAHGRWTAQPNIVTTSNDNFDARIPICHKLRIKSCNVSNFNTFSSEYGNNTHATIAYIPKYLLINSDELQKLIDWTAQRFWTQEELTKELYTTISNTLKTEDVYVSLACTYANKPNDITTTSYYRGKFSDPEVRASI